jgi:hypothetical protein
VYDESCSLTVDGTLDEAISQLEKVYENGHARGLMFDWS